MSGTDQFISSAVRYSIFTIIQMIVDGEIRIPEFQRPYSWTRHDINKLFTSIFEGYPIGTIFLWRTSDRSIKPKSNRDVPFPSLKMDYPTYFIVDGVQRLSTLFGILEHPSNSYDQRFNVIFNLKTLTFHQDSSSDLEPYKVRLSVLLSREKFRKTQREIVELPDGSLLFENLMTLYEAIRFYNIPVVILHDYELAEVIDIFIRINDGGKPLLPKDRKRAKKWQSR